MLRDKDGRSLKRYKRRYNKNVWERLLTAVRHAKRIKEQLTVVGWLEKGRSLELDWIWYDGKTMDTDYVSPLRRSPALGIA